MSPLRAARPDDMPLTVPTLFLKLELHNAHPGTAPHHPGKQRAFLSQATDFIIHSRTAGSLGEALFRQARDNGWEMKEARAGAEPDEARELGGRG